MGCIMATVATALFSRLDLDQDGTLTREELARAAADLHWSWPEAPLLALLDRLTLDGPLDRETFTACLEQIARDRLGPYGAALTRAPGPEPRPAGEGGERRALLIIDPQRAFTEGCWMRSIGPGREADVVPLRRAFAACAALLARAPDGLEVMLTRCPFPPDSYPWDAGVAAALPADQPYFVKPGNSALFPPSNGFRRWLERLLPAGRDTLVLAGCTLNSCVRVTALEVQALMGARGLRVVVDPDLCGARASNHEPSAEFGGRSSVEAALEELDEGGVRVQRGVFSGDGK